MNEFSGMLNDLTPLMITEVSVQQPGMTTFNADLGDVPTTPVQLECVNGMLDVNPNQAFQNIGGVQTAVPSAKLILPITPHTSNTNTVFYINGQYWYRLSTVADIALQNSHLEIFVTTSRP